MLPTLIWALVHVSIDVETWLKIDQLELFCLNRKKEGAKAAELCQDAKALKSNNTTGGWDKGGNEYKEGKKDFKRS